MKLKKMLLAYFLSLETTCVTVPLYVESFFTLFHTTYHSFSFSTKKSYETQHLYSQIKIK